MLTCARRLSAVGSAVGVRVVSRPSPWGLGHLNQRGGSHSARITTVWFVNPTRRGAEDIRGESVPFVTGEH